MFVPTKEDKKQIIYFFTFIIVGLLLIRGCSTQPQLATEKHTNKKHVCTKDTVHDTVMVYVNLKKHYAPKAKDSTSIKHIDTLDYVRFYEDSLKDSCVTFYIKDSVSGKILARNIDYKLNCPKIITKTITIKDSVTVEVPKLDRKKQFKTAAFSFMAGAVAALAAITIIILQ